jgi:hypothetical protein
LAEYFRFCQNYHKLHGYRPNLPDVGYCIAHDAQSLLSYSFDEPVVTIDPVSTRNKGWDDFLLAYNEFCSEQGGAPLLNQTYGVTRLQVEKAFKDRFEKFAEYRKIYDPGDRLLNEYFRELLA